mgnify:FL=1
MRNEKDLLRLSMQFFAEDTTAEKEQNSGSADETLLEDLYPEEQEAPQNEETNAAFGGEDDEWILFVREHPDVTELPEQVVKRMAAGESLRTAYAMYENEMLRCRLAILSQNHGTAVKSPGSLLSEDGDTAEDPFLQGLFGERA